ncbi:MAG: hypothetical protein ACJ8C4_09580 [Gemmataceae bacterium]
MLAALVESPGLTVAELIARYLEHCETKPLDKHNHFQNARRLRLFCVSHGSLSAVGLSLSQITLWVDSHPQWRSPVNRKNIAQSIRTAFKWALDQKHIAENPLHVENRPRRVFLIPGEPLCRHCQIGRVHRPKGLCFKCYYTPGVPELYPSTSKWAHRGVPNFTGTRPLPEFKTAAEPGSPEKVEILIQRAAQHLQLWHPDDPTIPPDCISNGPAPKNVHLGLRYVPAWMMSFECRGVKKHTGGAPDAPPVASHAA